MKKREPIPSSLVERISQVRNKRARFVLDTILAKGNCSTTDLKEAGYDHPPRAARDAVDLGFALKRIGAIRSDGQRIAAYIFDERELDPNMTGRVALAKKEREALISEKGGCCNLCGSTTNLQIDHRVPYQVAGESQKNRDDPYQVLDGICNRRKSWACEHCRNWIEIKSVDNCLTCYWANQRAHTHVAMRRERRVDLIWIGEEVSTFDSIRTQALQEGHTIAEQIKFKLKQTP